MLCLLKMRDVSISWGSNESVLSVDKKAEFDSILGMVTRKSDQIESQLAALQKTTQTLVVVVFVLVLAVGGLFIKDSMNKQAPTALAEQAPTEMFPLVEKGKYPTYQKTDHIRGNSKAKYLLVEYSDFQCPFCQSFHPTVASFVKENGTDVAWVYRHFPLDSIHPQARPAALASECVAKLGGEEAFWTFTNNVFEKGLDINLLSDYVANAGVSAEDFEQCYSTEETKNEVEKQYQSGVTFGIQGTPGAFLINTKNNKAVLISGALPLDQLKEALKKIQ